MTIIYPDINSSNKRCVYKLHFEDGSYYIGSTSNLRQRIGSYKRAFKSSIGSVNKLIANKADQFDVCWFFILEVVPDGVDPRSVEHKWILKHSKDPLILNRSRSAFNNSGMIKSR